MLFGVAPRRSSSRVPPHVARSRFLPLAFAAFARRGGWPFESPPELVLLLVLEIQILF